MHTNLCLIITGVGNIIRKPVNNFKTLLHLTSDPPFVTIDDVMVPLSSDGGLDVGCIRRSHLINQHASTRGIKTFTINTQKIEISKLIVFQ